MRILLKFFASYREAVGKAQEEFDAPRGATVKEVVESTIARYPTIGPAENALFILNQKIVDGNAKLREGDTLAIFPPVGGG